MRAVRFALSVSVSFLLSISLAAQQSTPSSPQAQQLLQRSLSALAGSQTLSDVTLSGTARRVAGSLDESGTATVKAVAGTGARLDLTLPSGPRSEIANLIGTNPAGSWSGPDGVAHPIANHNLMTDSSWFFPTFTVRRLVAPSNYVLSYVGHETRNGQAVEHVMAYQPSSGPPSAGVPSFSHLTQMDLFLDSDTLLPAALTFNAHPDNNMGLDIPLKILFSDYRAVSGAQIPFHVQKFLNNSLFLDLQFQSTTLNSGLSAAAFNAL
jgi:hypothetical protein